MPSPVQSSRFTHNRGPPRWALSRFIGSSGVGRWASPSRLNRDSRASREDVTSASLELDLGETDDLTPLHALGGEELRQLLWRAADHDTPDSGIGVDDLLAVQGR